MDIVFLINYRTVNFSRDKVTLPPLVVCGWDGKTNLAWVGTMQGAFAKGWGAEGKLAFEISYGRVFRDDRRMRPPGDHEH